MSQPVGATVGVVPERFAHDDLWQQLAYLAYHLHWSLDSLLDLEHGDRVGLLRQVAQLNERALERA